MNNKEIVDRYSIFFIIYCLIRHISGSVTVIVTIVQYLEEG
jgi:hypothetical protein